MATIVDIRSASSGKSVRAHGAPAKGSAEILIFTGVRYSRWEDGRSEGSKSSARHPRDRLDLQD